MIVFNLDNTLANCEHRNYFIDPEDKHPGYLRVPCAHCTPEAPHRAHKQVHRVTNEEWKPDWDGFDNACSRDRVNRAGARILKALVDTQHVVEIWTGRSENVREKTVEWLKNKIWLGDIRHIDLLHRVKMRPVGNTELEGDLKLEWIRSEDRNGSKISMAVESQESMVRLWTQLGIPCVKIVDPN